MVLVEISEVRKRNIVVGEDILMTNRNPDMDQSESGVEWLVNSIRESYLRNRGDVRSNCSR